MSLILCRQEPVTVPLYIEDLGIHLYSSQELCYVIYNNPLLVLEGFIDKRLTEFLRPLQINLSGIPLELKREM